MKRIVFSVALLSLCSAHQAMELVGPVKKPDGVLVQLPAANIIEERLLGAGYRHFCEETHIYKKLGNFCSVSSVANTVLFAVNDYNQYCREQCFSPLSKADKYKIAKLILQDSPQALEHLEQHLRL
jgi:hypothetical protein